MLFIFEGGAQVLLLVELVDARVAVIEPGKRPGLDRAQIEVITAEHSGTQGQGVGLASQLLVKQHGATIGLDQQVAF